MKDMTSHYDTHKRNPENERKTKHNEVITSVRFKFNLLKKVAQSENLNQYSVNEVVDSVGKPPYPLMITIHSAKCTFS